MSWRSVLGVGVGVAALGGLLGATGAAQILVGLGFVAVVGDTVRSRPEPLGRPWRLLLLGAMLALAHTAGRALHGALVDEADAAPSVADLIGLLAYGTMIAGAAAMVRAQSRESRREDTTDATILAVALGLIVVGLVLAPLVHDPSASWPGRAVLLASTASVLALAAVVTRLSFGAGVHHAPHRLVLAAALCVVLDDVILRGTAAGWAGASDLSGVLIPVALTAIAAAVRHPQADALTAPIEHREPTVGRGRLLVLACALLVGPALLVAAEFGLDRVDRIGTICGTALLALLVLSRMADLVRAKDAASERERHLRDIAGRLAGANDRETALRAWLDGAIGLAVDGPTSRAVVYGVRADGLQLMLAQGVGSHDALDAIAMEDLADRGVDLVGPGASSLGRGIPLDQPTEPDRHVLVVPIRAEHADHAVVVVTQTSAFTRQQVVAYERLASQVSVVLESLHLREAMHQRRSNRRFRALVENASDVVMVVDADGIVSFASPTVRRLLGREEATVEGAAVLDLVYRPDAVHVRRVLAAPTGPGGTRTRVQVRMLHGSGELRWFEVEARDLTAEDEVRGIVLTASDISDRKRAEMQLLRSEARFRLMVQNSSDVVAIVDEDSLISYVSPSVEGMLGYSVADMIGRNVFELLPVTEAERLRSRHMSELTDGRREVHVQAADGRVLTLDVGVNDLRSRPEVDGIVLNIRDVTDRRALEDHVRHAALHDDLTDLPNRSLLADRVTEALRAIGRTHGHLAVLFVNLDDFKLINDSFGHGVGDEVLLEVAARLQLDLRVSDLAARLGADEFAVLLGGVPGPSSVDRTAARLRARLGRPIVVDGHEFHLTASVGIAVTDGHDVTAQDLLRQADAAMHAAKRSGKDRHLVFEEEMRSSAADQLATKNALVRAIEHDEFVLHYQPIVELTTGQIRGIEALIRWEDPERGMVSPASFIPIAEETGLIRPIGLWVARQAAADLARWQASGFDVYCSINVSGRQLDDPDFADSFMASIAAGGAAPTAVVVELTESILAAPGVVEVFDRFAREGFRLALDDFGTGYSAFQYLQRFDIDLIKIDRSFVQALDTADDAGVVQAVVDVAERIGATTLAEGIENTDELRTLEQLGVELGQGYYFSKPVPADRLEELLRREQLADVTIGAP